MEGEAMEKWFDVEWSQLLVPRMSLLEIFLRATIIVLFLCVLLRLLPKRQVGKSTVNDMMFIVLVGGLAVRAMDKQAQALPDFTLLILMVVGWSWLLDRLAYHFPWVRWLLHPAHTCLVHEGQMLHHNLRREKLTAEDLHSELRRQGVDDLSKVKTANLEADGKVSIIKREQRQNTNHALGQCPAASRNGFHEENRSTTDAQVPANSDNDQEVADIERFLAAARQLQTRLTWHQEQAAVHKAQATHFRQMLAAHGIRMKAVPPTDSSSPTETHSHAIDSELHERPT